MFLFQRKNVKIIEVYDFNDNWTVSDISCFDDDHVESILEEQKMLQSFLNDLLQEKKFVLTGSFYENHIDDCNLKNIIKKIDYIDEKFERKNAKLLKKSFPIQSYFYLERFDVTNELFIRSYLGMESVSFWNKEAFSIDDLRTKRDKKLKSDSFVLSIFITEVTCISVSISKKYKEIYDMLLGKLKDIGYEIIVKKR